MKKLILISVLFLFNCKSNKTTLYETQKWIEAQNFTIKKPDGWRAFKHHGHVGYTPIKKGKNPFNALVSVFKYELTKKPDFKKFVQNQIRQTNNTFKIVSQKIYPEKNELGNVYIHKFELNSRQKYVVYFQQKGAYYYYDYGADKSIYKKHFKDAISILKSLKFKKLDTTPISS